MKLEFRGEASAGDTLLIIKQSYILYITNYFHLRILGTEMTTEEIRSAKERNMTKVNPWRNHLHRVKEKCEKK